MSKNSNAKKVVNLLNKYSIPFKVLDSNGIYPIHIRAKDVDIWPSTGSYRIGNKTVKKNHTALINHIEIMVGIKKSKSKAPAKEGSKENKQLLSQLLRLEVQVDQLQARMDRMEGIL